MSGYDTPMSPVALMAGVAPVARPSPPPVRLTPDEAYEIAVRVSQDSYDVSRADLEALAQWVIELDTAPHEALAETRQALAAMYLRLDMARARVAELEAQLRTGGEG